MKQYVGVCKAKDTGEELGRSDRLDSWHDAFCWAVDCGAGCGSVSVRVETVEVPEK